MIRGLTWLQNGYPDRAAAVYSEGLKTHPANAALLASMATAQQAMGELGTARFYLDQAIQYAPGQPALVSQDLDLALASGNQSAALVALERMMDLDEFDSHYLLRHLNELMKRGSSGLGLQLASRGVELFPDDADIVHASMIIFIEQGQVDAAIRSSYRLNELRGSFDDALRLSRLLMQAGRWAEAFDVLAPLLSEEPDDAELLAMMADLDSRLPNRDLVLETGIRLPTSEATTDAEIPSDSLSIYRHAWQEDPSDEDRVVRLARFLMQTERATEAAVLVDEHIAEYPRHLRVWTLTIDTWLAAGEAETALNRSEDAILLFPGYPPIVMARARALAANGNHEAAVRALDDLLERAGNDPEVSRIAEALREQFLQPQ